MKKIAFRLNFLTACVSLGIASQASAGHTYFGINYQYYRDFAENKGKFTVGAQDIDIYNKKGEMIGTMMKGVPMPDLSSLAKGGYATLVGDQTLISVAHNVGYQDVDFGMTGHNPDQHNFKYKVVKRYNYKNDSTHRYMTDYQHPRLAKFVTEVAPIEMVSRMNGKVYTDLKKYPMRVRVGSGHQYWKDDNNNTNADLAYGGAWLTGGNTFMDGGTGDGHLYLNGRVQTPNEYGPLPIAGAQGDSGSPFFIYDKEQGKWLLNGVLREGHPYAAVGNGYQIARQDYLEEVLEQDLAARFFLNNANYTLKTTQDGNGTITQNGRRSQTIGLYNSALPFDSRGGNNGDEAPTYKGPNPWSPALHHGKNIYLGDMGKGTLTIENTVNQGAGGLYFEGDFAVKPSDNTVTWQGAGVSVGEESTVEWQVHNPEGDRLSKIGLGTLLVNGKGKNLGSLSVGNGLVVLDQQADDVGQKQAFKEVGIVSGRATVKLNSENQVDPNNIYFGFRGGRLDLNGHSLTFERIQNIDEGAMLVNRNETQAANITITGNATVNSDAKQLTNKKYIAFNGWFGEQDKAKTNGRLNVNYQPVNAENHLLLSGGTNLNGNITQNGGTLVFSGRPTPHAYNHLNQNHAKMEGSTRGEVIIDDDWINRTFTAENFQIQNGQAVVSRNVSAINGNWQLSNNAKATFGVTPNQENLVCIRSDWTGLTECKSENLTEQKTIDSLPRTKVNGNVHLMSSASAVASGLVDLIGNVSLAQNSQFTLSHNATQTGSLNLVNQANATVNNARLMGNVTLSDSAQFNLANSRFSHQISGTESTTVNLENANWTMPASTTLGSLALNNSEITLNPDFVTQANNSQFNTLTINGNLSGNGIFNYRTYLHQYLGDKLEVNGQAQGDFKLKVHNTGAEPTALEHLTLMTLQQMPSSGLNVTLADNYVDVGTWRYELVKDGNQYRLYSPMKEAELQAEEAKRLAEEQRKAEEAKRLAEEQRKAEEAKRLAEEQRKAEEAKRLAEEQRKAEEAKRLAEEQRKAEEAKRLAEEQRKAEEAKRLAEEQRKAEEAKRLAEEQRKAEEAKRFAEEQRKAEEAKRLAEEQRKAEEAKRLEEEQRKAEEAKRLAEEQRKAEEAKRLAEEQRKAEEAKRLAEEQRKAEEAKRLAEEQRKAEEAKRLAEEQRKAEEAKCLAEEQRKAEEAKRLAEEQRKAEEAKRLAEEQRKAEEAKRLAEEQRKAEEAKRLAEEQRKAEEAKRLAEEQRKAEEAKRLAEEQRKAEEAKRLAEEQRKAEEAKRLAEEQRKAEEAKRLAEEQRQAEEAKRLAEEQRKAEEAKRLAEEQRKAEEAKRLAEEQRKAEEAKRLAEEQRKAEEAKRLAEEQRKAEEAKRLAEEQRKAEEAKRLAEEQRKAEEAKRLAEEQRKAEEAKRLAEEQRKAEEAKRLAEEQRKAEEAKRLAEEQRKAEEAKRLAEEQRKAEEAKRLAEEQRKVEEAKRLAEEQRKAEEAKRLAEEQRQAEEAKRLAEEQRKAEEAKRLAEEQRKAEEAKRLAEEQHKAEEAKRLAEEQRKAEEAKRLAEEQRKAEEAKRLAEEQRKAEEAKRLAEEQRKAEEAKRLAEEQRKAEEAKRLAEEQRKAEEAKRLAEEQRKAEEAKRLAEEQRKAEEAKRLAEEQRKAEEAKRLAEEQRKAEEAKRLAEEQRKAEEEQRKAEEAKRLAEEQRKAEEAKRLAEEAKRLAEEQRKAEEAKRLAEEQRKAEEAKRLAEEQRKAEEAKRLAEEAKRLAEEQRKAEEAKRLAEEQRKAEEAKRLAEEQRKAEEAKRLAEEQRKAEEAKRLAEEQRKAEEAKRLAEEQRKAEEAKRKQKELISRYSNSALSELSATVNGMLSVQHELDRVFVSDSDLSVWTNITQDKKRYDSDDFRAYQQNMNLRQIGVKKKVGNGRIGAIFSHGRANNTFDDQISNQMDLTMVSAFAQYQWHDWQLGVNSGYGVSSSKISGEQSQKIHRRVMSYGLNANYQFRLGELGVQPYLGVSRHFIEGENYQYEGVNIQTPKIAFNSYTTGVKVDYTFTPAQDVTIKPYFSVNYVDASNARVQTKVNQATLQQQFGRYWQKELGVSGEISHFHMSVYAAQSQGSQLSKQRTIGVKLGYRW